MEPRGAGPGVLTVVDGVGSGAMTRLQFGVNIIPLQERSGGAITDDAREGNAHSCWGVGLSGGGWEGEGVGGVRRRVEGARGLLEVKELEGRECERVSRRRWR